VENPTRARSSSHESTGNIRSRKARDTRDENRSGAAKYRHQSGEPQRGKPETLSVAMEKQSFVQGSD
jgi:hypothetical protein